MLKKYFGLLVAASVALPVASLAAKRTKAHKQIQQNSVQSKRARKSRKLKLVATDIVHINTFNAKQLLHLKGIGPKRAAAIVAYRNQNGSFSKVADLAAVKGVGKTGLARLQKLNADNLAL